MPVIGPTVVARSAIEISSGAWWLMEPGIGARVRVCRELVLSLTSARRAKQLATEFRNTGSTSATRSRRPSSRRPGSSSGSPTWPSPRPARATRRFGHASIFDQDAGSVGQDDAHDREPR
jgi:hypothetical protein